MTNPWIAALAVLFLWWFSTGAILWRVRRADLGGPDDHLWSVLLGLPLLLGGFLALHGSAADASAAGAWTAFGGALAVWAWVELAFLSGVITGPNRRPARPGPLARRFLPALGTILWHEVALVAALATIAHVTAGQPNQTGLAAFATLFAARVLAKLNLFFGVPRIHVEFIPRPLAHLPSHFRRRGPTLFWFLAVAALALATLHWIAAARGGDAPHGAVLVAALTGLALAEHLFMVLPLPDQRLWRWLLPVPPPTTLRPPPPPPPTTAPRPRGAALTAGK